MSEVYKRKELIRSILSSWVSIEETKKDNRHNLINTSGLKKVKERELERNRELDDELDGFL